MLKKYTLTFLVISFSLGLYVVVFKNRNIDVRNVTLEEKVTPTASVSNNLYNQNEIKIDNYTYSSNWFYVSDLAKLILIPNWDQKITSEEIIAKENCRYLSNAGFYSKDEKPIGLFVIGNTKYSNFSKNNLFNGIFSKISENEYSFSQNPLEKNTILSLQSGPIIVNNFRYVLSNNLSEEGGRRNIILSNIDKKLIFITIYNKNSSFDGPRFSNLPEIIDSISKNQGWKIENALNLDGGTASTFKNDDIYLKELSLVGSFFCVKN